MDFSIFQFTNKTLKVLRITIQIGHRVHTSSKPKRLLTTYTETFSFALTKVPIGPALFPAPMAVLKIHCEFCLMDILYVFWGGLWQCNQAVTGPQQIRTYPSLLSEPLRLVIKENKKTFKMYSAILRPLTMLSSSTKMHIIVNTSAVMCRVFWTSVQFPLGVSCKPPELPCCQEVWVPGETPLHLPGTLQVDCSDILFSHRQIVADRERKKNVLKMFYRITLWNYFI